MKPVRRTLFLLAAGAAAGAAAVTALRPTVIRSTGWAAGVSPVEAALDATLPEVWMVDVPLDEAVRRVADMGRLPVSIDGPTFAAAGVPADRRVTVRSRNLSVAAVLDDLAAGARSAGEGAAPVAWYIDGERVVLTAGVAGRGFDNLPVQTRTYDVHDLLAAAAASPQGDGLFCWPSTGPADPLYDLGRLVQETVAADTWREAGGAIGAVRSLGDRLVITQTSANHREIRRLLAAVRSLATSRHPTADRGPPVPEAFRWHAKLGKWVSELTDRGDVKLRAVLPEFRVDQMMLRQAVARLAEAAKLDVVFADDAAGRAAADRRVSVGRRRTTAGEVLGALLHPSAAADPPTPGGEAEAEDLTWWQEGEVVVVGPQRDWRYAAITRAYDVRDYLTVAMAGRTAEVPGSPLPFPVGREAAVADLTSALFEAVDPDSWREAGGTLGAARELGGHLIVTQSWANHEKARRWIDDLRRNARPAIRPAGAGYKDRLP